MTKNHTVKLHVNFNFHSVDKPGRIEFAAFVSIFLVDHFCYNAHFCSGEKQMKIVQLYHNNMQQSSGLEILIESGLASIISNYILNAYIQGLQK